MVLLVILVFSAMLAAVMRYFVVQAVRPEQKKLAEITEYAKRMYASEDYDSYAAVGADLLSMLDLLEEIEKPEEV